MTKDELVTVVTKAMIARNAVRAYKNKNKIAPKVKIKEVLDFQKVEPLLTKDSFWGPNAVAAATYYLSKSSDSEVPKQHPAYDHIAVTWKPPVVDVATKAAIEAPPPKPKEPEVKKEVIKTVAEPTKKATGGLLGTSSAISKLKKSAQKAVEVASKSTPKYGQEKLNSDIDAEEGIADNHINAPIEKIKALLEEEEQSKQATNEHNAIVNSDKYQKDVVSRLKDIQGRVEAIQEDKKSNKKKKTDYRILGLIL